MPSIDGGPQNSREYSLHLYADEGKGEYIGNPLAKEFRTPVYKYLEIVKPSDFHKVFGADAYREKFPNIFTGPFKVMVLQDLYYLLNEQDQIIHDSAFFTQSEVDCCMAIQSSK